MERSLIWSGLLQGRVPSNALLDFLGGRISHRTPSYIKRQARLERTYQIIMRNKLYEAEGASSQCSNQIFQSVRATHMFVFGVGIHIDDYICSFNDLYSYDLISQLLWCLESSI